MRIERNEKLPACNRDERTSTSPPGHDMYHLRERGTCIPESPRLAQSLSPPRPLFHPPHPPPQSYRRHRLDGLAGGGTEYGLIYLESKGNLAWGWGWEHGRASTGLWRARYRVLALGEACLGGVLEDRIGQGDEDGKWVSR